MARQIRKDMDTLLKEIEEAKQRLAQKKDQEKDLIYNFLTKELDNKNLDFESFKKWYDEIIKAYNLIEEDFADEDKSDDDEDNSDDIIEEKLDNNFSNKGY